ncbi:MAG: type I-C CRISPR-associated protein Cas8c/Csd1 [Selenomonadaceae bacterium]|nr:type I-C CRISPR-associated protein Cas8c/Csd1 [Selenomonadaceae bacterium]
MILETLVRRYEKQAEEGKIARRGWSKTSVSFGLRISESGEIADILDLRIEMQRGKKIVLVPKEIEVPEQAGKTSKIISNFLCDNVKYFLGIGGDIKYFEKAKKLHQEILANCNSPAANAVKNFLKNGNRQTSKIIQSYRKI